MLHVPTCLQNTQPLAVARFRPAAAAPGASSRNYRHRRGSVKIRRNPLSDNRLSLQMACPVQTAEPQRNRRDTRRRVNLTGRAEGTEKRDKRDSAVSVNFRRNLLPANRIHPPVSHWTVWVFCKVRRGRLRALDGSVDLRLECRGTKI